MFFKYISRIKHFWVIVEHHCIDVVTAIQQFCLIMIAYIFPKYLILRSQSVNKFGENTSKHLLNTNKL